MRTQKEVEEALEILEKFPRLKLLITPGIDSATILSRNSVRSLSDDEFKALCSLPLDIILPDLVRDIFLSRARECGIKLLINSSTKGISIKKFE